ncbi:KGGVGR-motif variant AAA ATPase [Candidatus Uabimicrobium sp. HlEnr_7]|uniref:leucine-rich repeat domain-containing protein n=1 Tax=Candidatus Uabimicrobium helgolandensis TaxID=3095367 RepID=UPI003558CB62
MLGKFITFYSYKGGTGRSMALANTAWALASSGYNVLAIDWDLEAPGLHRYFDPFLLDPDLENTKGIIELVSEYAFATLEESESENWYDEYTERFFSGDYKQSIDWDFKNDGCLDFIGAGCQNSAYPSTVTSFDWANFHERLQGGYFLEEVKELLRQNYDYILIDSRTGVSDTSGICTIQMPDIVVLLFTLNNQSIQGAAKIANAICNSWKRNEIKERIIYPLLSRVDSAESDRLNSTYNYAINKFSKIIEDFSIERKNYWSEMQIPYVPFYNYEEILVFFQESMALPGLLLKAMLLIAKRLSKKDLDIQEILQHERSNIIRLYMRQNMRERIQFRYNLWIKQDKAVDLLLCDENLEMAKKFWPERDKLRLREELEFVDISINNLDLSNQKLRILNSNSLNDHSGCKVLNLHKNFLGNVTGSISKLKKLIYLDISENILQSLPGEIGELSELNTLVLHNNKLRELPPEIVSLSNLKRLDLSVNKLNKLPKEMEKLYHLSVLDLRSNRLEELPGISQLKKLTKLDISKNELSILPSLSQLKNLRILDLRNNRLTTLPKEIDKCTKLNELYLDNNFFIELSAEITQLNELRKLYVGENKLTQLPKGIGQLNKLEELFCDNNQIKELSQEIGNLINLKKLYFGNNKLIALPINIGKLKSLRTLYLGENSLKELPYNIMQFSQLNELFCDHNQLASLPKEIGYLKNLTTLYLSGNKIKTLPKEIGQLHNLTMLDLSDNELTELPEEIGNLESLTVLNLSGNRLKTLPKEIAKLTNLTILFLDRNELLLLPQEMKELSCLKVLNLQGNDFELPSKIYEFLPVEQIKYLLHLQKQNKETKLLEIKMVIFGEQKKEKQFLEKLSEKSNSVLKNITELINTTTWQLQLRSNQKIKLNILDLGPEIRNKIHWLFITKRSLYVFLWDINREDKYEHLDYWLSTIADLAGSVPVLIVVNKAADEDDSLIDRIALKNKYPTIKDFIGLFPETEEGFRRLREAVKETVSQLEYVRTSWVLSWFEVKKQLEELSDNFVTYSHYQKLCSSQQITKEHGEILLQFLHDLGIVLYFRDNSDLAEIIVVKPAWLVTMIDSVLNEDSLEGMLTKSDVEKLLQSNAQNSAYTIAVMKKFKMCFDLKDNKLLIPQQFAFEKPQLYWPNTGIIFEYEYEILSPVIIAHFIAKTQKWYQICWREGVYIQDGMSMALIDVDQIKDKICIRISGAKKRNFLEHILEHFERIHCAHLNTKVQQKIKVPNHDVYLDYKHLIVYEEMKRIAIFVPEMRKELSVEMLLNGVDDVQIEEVILEQKPLKDIASVCKKRGEFGLAIRYYSKILEQEREKDDTIHFCDMIANTLYDKGELDLALEYYDKSLKLKEKAGDFNGTVVILHNIAITYHCMGELDLALKYYSESLLENANAISLMNVGRLYCDQGKLDLALNCYNKAFELVKKTNNSIEIALILGRIGGVCFDKGEVDLALKYYNESLELTKKRNRPLPIARSLCNVGNVYFDKGELNLALEYYDESLGLRKKIGDFSIIGDVLYRISRVYKAQNQMARSLIYKQQALSLTQDKRLVVVILSSIAVLYQKQNNMKEVNKTIARINKGYAGSTAYYNLARVYSLQEEKHQALEQLNLAFDKGFVNLYRLNKERDFDFIRSTSEYNELIQKIRAKSQELDKIQIDV